MTSACVADSVVTIPDFAMRYVSRYLGDDAIRIAILVYRDTCLSRYLSIAILVYRVSQCLDLQFSMMAMQYRPRYTLINHHNRCRM